MTTDQNISKDTEKSPDKSLYIKTWGCQMNVYDSHKMADVLAPLGYKMSDTPEGADMIILNTCHIREKATEKFSQNLAACGSIKQNPSLMAKKL